VGTRLDEGGAFMTAAPSRNSQTATQAGTAAEVLHPGGWFLYQGQWFEVLQWDAKQPLHVEARAKGASALTPFSLPQLLAATPPTRFASALEELSSADAAPSAPVEATGLPAALVQRATRIIEVVETVERTVEQLRRDHQIAGEPFYVTTATRQACQALNQPLSLSRYYVYRQLYVQHHGSRANIAAALRRSTFAKTQLDANTLHFVDTALRAFYRSNPPLRVQTVYAAVEQIWQFNGHWWLDIAVEGDQGTGLSREALETRLLDARKPLDDLLRDPQQRRRLAQIRLPSRTWFYQYVRWFASRTDAGAQAYQVRYGQAEWEANFLLFDQFANTATVPLQYVFADHYKLDVLHVDDEFRMDLGRLWLTVLVDAFSRAVLGLYLAYEAPCIESIQGALRHTIWPKMGLDAYGVSQPWATFGIPQRLFLDNAWAHHSYSLEDLARGLSGAGRYTHMELVFRPPYQARYGGLVERLFGNLSGQLRERLPGALLIPSQRRWHNASQGACLLFRDVERVLVQLIVDYLHTPHRELDGQTPHQRWLAGLQLMTPLPPPLTPQLERTFWRLHPGVRQATPEGLALFGLHYWDYRLAGLRAAGRRGERRQFQLRYDPLDISRVCVFEDGAWLGDAYARELRLPDGTYEPVSLWELDLAKRLAHTQTGRVPRKTHSWLVHLLEARELIAQRQIEQKAIRRKVQQLREQRRGRPPAQAPTSTEIAPPAEQPATPGKRRRRQTDPRARLLDSLEEVL
jgi:hypothetical protein